MDGYCLNSANNSICEKINTTTIPTLNSNYDIIGITGADNVCLTFHGSVLKKENCFSDFDNVCLDVTKSPLSCWDLNAVSTPDSTMA